MQILNLFSTPKRVKVINYLLEHPFEEIRVRNIATKVGVSPALVSSFVVKLTKRGVISGQKINFGCSEIVALKIFLNVNKLSEIKLVARIKKLFGEVSGIGVYGSWASGRNYSDSDLDLWIRAEKYSEKNLLKLRQDLKKELKIEPNILLLNSKNIKQLREKDFVFYCSLANSFILFGECFD